MSFHTRSPCVPLSGGVRGPPNPTGQGDSSCSLTSTPQFPKNALMVASLSTPKAPLALKARKAISYPLMTALFSAYAVLEKWGDDGQ